MRSSSLRPPYTRAIAGSSAAALATAALVRKPRDSVFWATRETLFIALLLAAHDVKSAFLPKCPSI
ncbi:hypothetical protein P3T76_014211 [Phytophthora citrophthora]|uniref:Uncharacterized protein n=1 Tax=Phytophthora citrophthora TaxID=4793 RepID=A0AAD9G1W1_9STRA|nr:hypothetical protein P3T76_014211 [Phytophthora citrophthora]